MVLRLVDLFKMSEKSPRDIITIMQNFNLIARSFDCKVCGKGMILSPAEALLDKYRWRCKICRTTRSVRIGSWFDKSKLPMVKILQITYGWVHKYTQLQVQWEFECTPHTTVDWYNFCREVCVEIVLKEHFQIGGPGTVVEIDESKFGKRKYYRGKHVEGQWVFGGVERGSNRCFLVTITGRSSATLVPLIKEFIAPGTTIVSDSWKAYDSLGKEAYEHLIVDHSLTFKDPDTHACKNVIRGLRACVKRQLPDCNRGKDMFSSYLGEFMYRRLREGAHDVFETFLQDIAKIYQPPKNDVDAAEDTDAAGGS